MRNQQGNAGGYTPDPEAETAMVIDAFFAGLGERFPGEDGLLAVSRPVTRSWLPTNST